MNWNTHSELEGRHSIFAPSTPSWMNYSLEPEDEGVIFQRYCAQYAASIGTITHEFAEDHIKYPTRKLVKANSSDLLIRLLKGGIPPIVIDMDYIYPNVMNYVNDAVGFHMDTEVKLKYSDIFFGTADCICYRDKTLRIHDLKTGKGAVHLDQLLAYASLFFLEYGKVLNIEPSNTRTILRIYYGGDILEDEPDPQQIMGTIHQIIELEKIVSKWKDAGVK